MKLTLEEIEKQVDCEKHSLELTDLDVTNKDVSLICSFLEANPDITTLWLDSNRINKEGAKELAANTTLTALIISGNCIGNEGAKALAANNTITTLEAEGNYIGDEGAIALAANTTLTLLDLSANNIGLIGVKALIENTTISWLSIERNKFDTKDIKEFVRVLKHNFTLFNLLHTIQDKSAEKAIEKIINRNNLLPWITTIRNARMMAQAQRSENCSLGTLPIEMLGLINDHVVGADHISFFMQQFDKRPSAQDLIAAKKIALS